MADAQSTWLLELISRAPMLMMVSKPGSGRCEWASPAVSAALGGTSAGRGPFDLSGCLAPDEFQRVIEQQQLALAGEEPAPLSLNCRRHDGRLGFFEGFCFPIHTYGGRILVGTALVEVTDLVAARGRAQHLLDHLPIVLTATDIEGNLLSLDGAGMQARRRSTPTRRRHIDDLFPLDSAARQSVDQLRAAALAGQVARDRYAWEGRWWESVSAPLTEAGEVTGVLTISTDVEDQVRIAAAQRAAEAKFEAFMRHCPAPAVIRDADGRVVWANQAWAAGCGTPVDDLPGTALSDVLDPDDAREIQTEDRRVLASSAPLYSTTSFRRRDGEEVTHAGFRFPLLGPENEPLVGGVFLDVSEATEREAELRRWRDRYRTLFDRSPSAMLVIDLDGLVLDANPAFCHLVGTPLTGLRGTMAADLTDDPGHALSGTHIRATLENGVTAQVSLGLRNWKRGTRHEADITLVLVNDTVNASGAPVTPTVVCVAQPTGAITGENSTLTVSLREIRVLELRAAGASHDQIGTRLGLSRRGVDYHVAQLAQKLNVPTAAIVARAYQLGLLTTAEWPPAVAPRYCSAASATRRGA
ncbi:PAS domain-containing protein [Amycolatopsis sp. NPDC004378]